MRYWDASALVPLVLPEPGSETVRTLLRDDGHIVTWAWTSVEIASAIERRASEGGLDRVARRAALARLGRLADAWDEVTDIVAVRRRAQQLLARHRLRAADAGQLAAAQLVSHETGPQLGFVCLDARLVEAAEREGLAPLPQ